MILLAVLRKIAWPPKQKTANMDKHSINEKHSEKKMAVQSGHFTPSHFMKLKLALIFTHNKVS